jgi:hypothetical protein
VFSCLEGRLRHSSVDVLESRAMEGGGRARHAGDGDEEEGTRLGASRHADGIRSSKNWSDAKSSPKRCFVRTEIYALMLQR